MSISNYIVIGYGRCGSHWVSEVCCRVLNRKEVVFIEDNSWQPYDANWVLHTHDISAVQDLDPSIKEKTCLIISRRHDLFSSEISRAIAEHTNEWYNYSNKQITPFDIDEAKFINQIAATPWAYKKIDNVAETYPTTCNIWFEDLIANKNSIESFIADKIDKIPSGDILPYTTPNARDYSKVVLNYDRLKDVTKSISFYQVDQK